MTDEKAGFRVWPPEKEKSDDVPREIESLVRPHPNPKFVLNANPFYQGTQLLNASILSKLAGLSAANGSMSIFTVTHIYNAFRHIGILERHWPEMDRAIELLYLLI
ncbi:hypothetical protein F4778DRAFT_711870 [Xylariomycetidae sp. FL2044]|nr:hypothetical protein F4778DRAFT_711870 [Xylariomycetidae sp. FL2044]